MDLQILQSIDLFRNLDYVQRAHLSSIIQEETVARGVVLFREGDIADRLYIIARGKVRISKQVPGIGEEALAILEEGTYFGEMEMIVPETPRAAQATVHERSELWSVDYGELKDLMRSDPELAMAFLWSFVRTLSERLGATNEKITAMFAMSRF